MRIEEVACGYGGRAEERRDKNGPGQEQSRRFAERGADSGDDAEAYSGDVPVLNCGDCGTGEWDVPGGQEHRSAPVYSISLPTRDSTTND